jgi:hypothetical protein
MYHQVSQPTLEIWAFLCGENVDCGHMGCGCVTLLVVTSILEKHNTSVFRVEIAQMGMWFIYRGGENDRWKWGGNGRRLKARAVNGDGGVKGEDCRLEFWRSFPEMLPLSSPFFFLSSLVTLCLYHSSIFPHHL